MSEKILVLCNSRVALNKALGQIVDKKTKRVVDRLESLHKKEQKDYYLMLKLTHTSIVYESDQTMQYVTELFIFIKLW